MIDRIRKHKVLSKYLADACCENGVCAEIDPRIPKDRVVIIKVDDFYNAKKIEKRPASPDCIIVQKCERARGYAVTIVELKDIVTGHGFDLENLKEKFRTALYDFIEKEFKDILLIDYVDITLLFITRQKLYRRDIGLKQRALMETRFKFQQRPLMIKTRMANPTIQPCYAT